MVEALRPYEGDDGEAYLQARRNSLTERNQELRASLFSELGGSDKTIIDFGCGSGGVLRRLHAKRRIGVEIGAGAAEMAREAGIEVVESLSAIPDATVHLAISFHAIEHVDCPYDVLREIGRVVRPDGVIRLVVPGELATHPTQRSWRPNRDRHLYAWTPLLFGNLAERAGYCDIHTRVAPMPTRSRLVRALNITPPLANLAHWSLAKRRNALNVILDARPPSSPAASRATSPG